MNTKRLSAIAILLTLSYGVNAMGLRSFVALPVEKGGTVYRGMLEHTVDTDANVFTVNMAYGISHTQTFLMGAPYHFSQDDGDHLGDAGLLYRHIVHQVDRNTGTQRIGLLAGGIIPTNNDRDGAYQAGGVYTFFKDRHEIDADVLYQQGLNSRLNVARYDLSWQYRLSPTEYPNWGIPNEWYSVSELGGRWQENNNTVYQFTFGLQRVFKRWVVEGGVIQDLNAQHNTGFLFSVRFH